MIQLKLTPEPDKAPILTLLAGPKPDTSERLAVLAFGAAFAAFGLLIALPYLLMPVPKLLDWVADDAFYYLQVARHIAHSGISSFDGVTRTNGYHPLWMLCCVLLAVVFHGGVALVKAALCLAFLCHAATALALARLLKPYTGQFWSKIIGATWLFNPLALHMCLCLTEAPLYILCLTAALIALRDACDINAPNRSALIRVGLALGIALLARTDAVCLIVPALITLAVYRYRQAPAPTRLRAACTAFFLPLAICCLLFTPWLAYSWTMAHTFAQDSGVMKSLWQTSSQNAAHLSLFGRLSAAARFTISDWLLRTLQVSFQLPFVAPGILGVSMSLSLALRRDFPLLRQMVGGTILLTIITLGMGMAYGYGVSDHQVWHLAEPALAIGVVSAGWIGALASRRIPGRYRSATGLAFLGAAAFLGVTGAREFAPHYPWQVDVYNSQPVLERMAPRGERIGCFNAGIPAYFSSRTIINLDGLVNHEAVPYWKSHRFESYLSDNQIRYIIDEADAVNRAEAFCGKPLKLSAVASGPLTGWNPPIRYLLRVDSDPKYSSKFGDHIRLTLRRDAQTLPAGF